MNVAHGAALGLRAFAHAGFGVRIAGTAGERGPAANED